MPTFRYKAYAGTGRETAGTISADNERQAALVLKEQGIYPRELSLEKTSAPKAGSKSLPFVTRELSLLVSSGVPLLDALKSLAGEVSGHWRDLLNQLSDDVSSGMSLTRALEQYPVFPPFYTKLVASGEASGTLDMVLKSLADFLDEEAKTKARVKSALIYPIFMLGVGAVVLSFIFGFVMPRIIRIFRDSGKALPLATKVLIGISNIFINYWWLLIILAILAVYGGRRYYQKERLKVDGLLLKVGLLRSLFLSRFTRAFGFLLEGGLPVLKALELAGPSSGNLHIEKGVHEAREKLSEGADLAQSLKSFPPVFIQLLSTGQKSGKLHEAVKKAATSYDEDFKRKLERALALVEPIMILAMGVIVAFIVMAVLLPIFELNQLIK
jgi:general secretion pathway protein F